MSYSRRGQILLTTTLLLLLLAGLCVATEFYVKPTTFQEISGPWESCYTLDELAAKYFYASATDLLMDNVTVIFINGTHESKGSIFVKEVNNFTMLGVGGIDGEIHIVNINCKGVSSLVFEGIVNLTITRIAFLQCGTLYQDDNLDALTFSGVFNLRLNWVTIHNSTNTAVAVVNVLGTSVIDHSVFQGFSVSGLQSNYYNTYHIFIGYDNCHRIRYKCSNKTTSLLHAVNSHKLHIHNCVLRNGKDGSVRITLYHIGYKVEVDLMNTSMLSGGVQYIPRVGDLSIQMESQANYLVTIRESYVAYNKGAAISVLSLYTPSETHASQLIQITNTIMDEGAAGIDIRSYESPPITSTTISQVVIENCIITKKSGTTAHGLRVTQVNDQFSVVLRNVSFQNNTVPKGVICLDKSKGIELIDCRFVGNKGTPITLYNSTLKVSGTLSFVNNMAYKGGAMAFHKGSYMSISLENNTQMRFINNYAGCNLCRRN